MKTVMFLVSIALAAVSLSGCSAGISLSYPPARSEAGIDVHRGCIITIRNPSPYDQEIHVFDLVYKCEAMEPFRVNSGCLSGDFSLPQGKYEFRAIAIDTNKSIRTKRIVPASGYLLVETAM